MHKDKIQEIKLFIENKANSALEWYLGCVACDETSENIRRNILSIMEEASEKFKINPLPFTFKLILEDNGRIVVVKFIDRKLN